MQNPNQILFSTLDKINTPILILSIDTKKILFSNKNATEKFGYILDKLCQKIFSQNNTDEKNFTKEIKIFSGSTSLLNATHNIINLPDKTKVRLITIEETINETTINKLLYSERRFRALSEASFEAILILKNGFIIEANERAYEMFGYEHNTLRQKFASIIIAPEKRDFAKEKMLSGYEKTYESVGITQDNNKINIEIRGKMIEYRGEKVRVTAIRNISKRKKAEKRVLYSEERFRALSDASFEAIFIIKEGFIVEANNTAYKMFCYKENTLRQKFASIIIAPEKREAAKEKMLTGYEEPYESIGITKNNKKIYIEIRGKMIDYMGEKVRVTAIRDISQRKKAVEKLIKNEKKLKELNATKDKFFSIIAHDLKNPFSQLLSFTDLIYDNINDYSFDEIKEYIKLLNKSAQNGYDLLENLLEWARSQTGRKDFNPQNFVINELIDKNFSIFELPAKNKSIILNSNLKTKVSVFADYFIINTILYNLISNAIKFTTNNGEINISAKASEKMVIISIKDTGIGILPENINKLFRIDVHFSTKGTNNESGTGLGLILCYEFIKLNNGKIWVESELDKGSTFYISIPKENKK